MIIIFCDEAGCISFDQHYALEIRQHQIDHVATLTGRCAASRLYLPWIPEHRPPTVLECVSVSPRVVLLVFSYTPPGLHPSLT